ncbi:MBL fold metallo-hydrolase [Bacillus kwashiorkori]|uniref:MBL fold metallo-hydrolase n=1 Tax=Bacillus kwashiorkori TaxID=1522318 RepID=UPI00078439E3|nr:MBL fold metallo-hydrolase [Bacillus kwashiorkori]
MAQWYGNIGKITLPTPFAVGDVNVYIVKGDTLTLVDAAIKTDETWEIFVHELKQLGYNPKDIEQVVITHHHPDHVGLLDYLEVPIIGHEYNKRWLIRDEEFMREYREFYSRLFDEAAVPQQLKTNIRKMEATLQFSSQRSLNLTVEEGMEIPGLPGWFVIETPGHAQSHISLIHQKKGIVIGGDHIFATQSSNPLFETPLIKNRLLFTSKCV